MIRQQSTAALFSPPLAARVWRSLRVCGGLALAGVYLALSVIVAAEPPRTANPIPEVHMAYSAPAFVGLNPADVRNSVAISAGDDPSGKQILLLFQCDQVSAITPQELISVRELIADHSRLRPNSATQRYPTLAATQP